MPAMKHGKKQTGGNHQCRGWTRPVSSSTPHTYFRGSGGMEGQGNTEGAQTRTRNKENHRQNRDLSFRFCGGQEEQGVRWIEGNGGSPYGGNNKGHVVIIDKVAKGTPHDLLRKV